MMLSGKKEVAETVGVTLAHWVSIWKDIKLNKNKALGQLQSGCVGRDQRSVFLAWADL